MGSPEVSIEPQLEMEARNTLLQHFSSKSTNQTTLLLSYVIAVFTFLQASPILMDALGWIYKVISAFVVWVFACAIIRSIGRLVDWGKHADAVLLVKMLDTSKSEKIMKEENPIISKIAKEVGLTSTHQIRLYWACSDYLTADLKARSRRDVFRLVYTLTHFHWIRWIYILSLIGIVCFPFLSFLWEAVVLLLSFVLGMLWEKRASLSHFCEGALSKVIGG